MFQFATRISIINDGFRSTLQDVSQVLHARSQVYGLNIGFSFRGGICERRTPHSIETISIETILDFQILTNKTRQSIMDFKNTHHFLSIYQPTQRLQTHIGGGTNLLNLLIERR